MGKVRSFFTLQRLLLIGACFLLYANTLFNDYAIDDSIVTQKPNITTQGISAIPKLMNSSYGTDDSGQKFDYRPMVKVSFALEHQLLGVHPALSHLMNVLLYCVCVLLVYAFLGRFVDAKESAIPFYAALLFAFLPIHTEVAASLKNRDILLCFIFCLLAAIQILKAHEGNRMLWHYCLAACFLYCGFLSKFDALPYIFILSVIPFVKDRKKFKFFALGAVVFTGVYVLNRLTSRAVLQAHSDRVFCYFENPIYFSHDAVGHTVALLDCLGFYTVQCLAPFKQVCYYGVDTISVLAVTPYGWLGLAVILLLPGGLAYAYQKQKKELLLGILIFSASVSMYLNFVRPVVGIVADRFIFFGSLGMCIILISLLAPVLKASKMRIVSLLVLLVYSGVIISRNMEWKNANTLLAADVRKYPNSAYLNYLYATGMMDTLVKMKDRAPEKERTERVRRIRAHLEKSVAIANDYARSLSFLSAVLVTLDRDYQAALPVVNRGLALQKSAELLFYKGLCLAQLNKPDSALVYLNECIKTDPGSYPAYNLLADLYNQKNQPERSIDLYTNALKSGQENTMIYSGLATAYLLSGDSLSAEFYCQKALALDPNDQKAKSILNQVLGH